MYRYLGLAWKSVPSKVLKETGYTNSKMCFNVTKNICYKKILATIFNRIRGLFDGFLIFDPVLNPNLTAKQRAFTSWSSSLVYSNPFSITQF